METMDRSTLEGKLLPELQHIAQTMGIEGTQRLRKAGLIDAIVEASSNGERPDNGEAMRPPSRESAVATTEPAQDGAVDVPSEDQEDRPAEATGSSTSTPESTSDATTDVRTSRDDRRPAVEDRPRDDRQGGRSGT